MIFPLFPIIVNNKQGLPVKISPFERNFPLFSKALHITENIHVKSTSDLLPEQHCDVRHLRRLKQSCKGAMEEGPGQSLTLRPCKTLVRELS